MTNRILRYSGLGLAVLAAGAIAACSSDDPTPAASAGNPGTGGAHTGAGAGGAPATAGATNTAGSNTAGTIGTAGSATAGSGGGASVGYACSGTALTSDVITDFSNLVASPTSTGNYTFVGGVMGGTFSYQTGALTLDTVGNTALKVTGNVKAYDGFGLYFNTCYNAGAYTGVSFSVKGYAGPKGKLNFRVQTNANTAIMAANMKGTCVSTAADTYADCHASSFDVPVTATATVVTVMFSQLKDGVPVPVVDGKDVVGLEWAFDWTPAPAGSAGASAGGAANGGAGGSGGASGGSAGKAGGATGGSGGAAPAAGPYDADVTIDDVKFIGGPVIGAGGASAGGASAGGASAGGAGGASAGAGGAKAGSGGTGG